MFEAFQSTLPMRGATFEGIQSYAVATEYSIGGGLSVETHRHYLTPEQAIAATLDAGTCKVESMRGYTDAFAHTSWHVELSCHTLDAWEDTEPPNYCPICGRKVVE